MEMHIRDDRDRRLFEDLFERLGVFFSGTATRTMSAPAAVSLWISATHLSMSCVYPAVMVWTETGARAFEPSLIG